MIEQTERWQLGSGTWYRDLNSERWRLATTPNGTAVSAKLSSQDVAHMIRAMRDTSNGQWLPPDFTYSPLTGTQLQVTIASLDSTWIPPHGAAALSDLARPSARGLRQTPLPLALAIPDGELERNVGADKRLPALPPGAYRFLVHRFDAASATLMAIEPEQGTLLVLLPESKTWMPLEHPAGVLVESLMHHRGWRMEVVEGPQTPALYFPTIYGLAVVMPSLIGLSYAIEYFGEARALGGPVGWAGAVWLPVLGENNTVNLVGKPPGAAKPIVLSTPAPAPRNGFEAPVFDPVRVVWPSDEGQLVLRLNQQGNKDTDWIPWPDGLKPAFSLGCPYLSPSGSFSQLCLAGQQALEYVELGTREPARVAVDEPRLCTGHISYRKTQRLDGDPWEGAHINGEASSEVVVPLLESQVERQVVGMRIEAPLGVLALLESVEETTAVLQWQAPDRPDVPIGTLSVARPWEASLFIYDAHMWVYHAQLPKALGWKLER